MNELLDHWDDELSVESVVSRLLHLPPTEENFKRGCEMLESLITQQSKETIES